jgi:glycosyltransferase involved in cell wall biosynthesis
VTGRGPLVSFVMPARSPRADWLRVAVGSVLGQEGCRLELVLVDDGSPAPVEGLLGGLEDARLRVLRTEHGGASAARNAGLAAIRGDLVRFVDADDAFGHGSTARLAALSGGAAIAYGATAMCDAELRTRWVMRSRASGDVRAACLQARFSVRQTSLLYPRAVVERAGGWDPSLSVCEDWDFVQRAVEHAPVRGERRIATYYRRWGGSATADIDAGARGAEIVVDRYFARHPEQRGTAIERRARARLDAVAARVWLTHGRARDGVALAARAARRDPRSLTDELAQALAALGSQAAHRLRG